MPQMWYALFIAFVFSLINAFKCFREIFLVGGEHPHPSVYMLQHFINNSFENLNYQRLSVASVLLFLVVALVLGVCALWVLRKGGGPAHGKSCALRLWGWLPPYCWLLSAAPLCMCWFSAFSRKGPPFRRRATTACSWGSQEYLLNFWRSLFLCAVIVAGQVVLSVFAGLGFASTPSPGRTSGFSCCWW